MREPWALTRSPTSNGAGSWRSDVARIADDTSASRPCWGSAAGLAVATAATIDARCSGVVPQHPPTMRTPNSVTNSRSIAAIGSGSSG